MLFFAWNTVLEYPGEAFMDADFIANRILSILESQLRDDTSNKDADSSTYQEIMNELLDRVLEQKYSISTYKTNSAFDAYDAKLEILTGNKNNPIGEYIGSSDW